MWQRPGTSDPTTQRPGTADSNWSASQLSSRIRNPGRRFGQIIKVKPDQVQKYKELHAATWPEVLTANRNANIRDYRIFFDADTNTLFASFTYVGYDFEGDMARLREEPKVREWWKLTDAMQESLVPGAKGSAEGQWWKPLEEVFYQA